MGIHTVSLGGVNIIVSEDTMDQLAIASEGANPYVYLKSSDPMATQAAIEDREGYERPCLQCLSATTNMRNN